MFIRKLTSLKIALFLTLIISTSVQAAKTRKFVSGSIPSLLRTKISQYLGTYKKDIREVVATKSGDWVIVADGLRYWSNTTLFDNIGLRPKVNSYLNAGRTIDAIAIDKNNKWVVTSANFRFFSDTRHFDRTGLRPAINRQIARNRTVSEVAIAANDSWAIIANGFVYYSNNLPTTLKKAIVDSRKQGLVPRVIKFQPGTNLWIFIAGQKIYTSQTLAQGSKIWASKYREMGMQTDEIFLAPNRGWSVISNNTINRGTTLADQWEWNFNNKSVHSRIDYHKAAGISVAFIKNGRVDQLRTYGYRNYEQKLHVHTDTIFPVASVSKAVGAFTMAHAHDHNVLSLYDMIPKYTNQYPNSVLATWQNTPGISLKRRDRLDQANIIRMMSHNAGTNKHGIGTMRPPVMNAGDEIMGRRNGGFVQFTHDAGTKYDYSGGGFALAETILELTSSQGAINYLNDVLAELKMRNSTFGSMQNKLFNLSRMHTKDLKVMAYEECPVKTAGGLFSTPTEYSYFLRALINDGKNISRQQVIDPKLVKLMMTPMHTKNSSLSFCRWSNECLNGETCLQNKCMNAIRAGGNYVGLGLMLESPFNVKGNRPKVIKHGGSQQSTRTQFLVNLEKQEGMIIFMSGSRSWKNDPSNMSEPEKGTHKLITEAINNYRSLVGW